MEQKVTEDTAYNAEMVKYARKTKSIHWQYEEEWRYWFSLTKSEKSEKSADPRKVFFTPFNDDLVLKEVVFGHRSELRQEKIKEILESSEGIKFTTARPSFREFAMVPQNRKDMQK